MELTPESFIALMTEQFKSEKEKISFKQPFRNMVEWSSLQALIVIVAIDEAFGVSIEELDLRNAITFGDLYYLASKK